MASKFTLSAFVLPFVLACGSNPSGGEENPPEQAPPEQNPPGGCTFLTVLAPFAQGEVDLRGADLSCQILIGDFKNADLSNADLHGSSLDDGSLSGANLEGANLHGADLRGVDFSHASLVEADLSEVDLSGANFTEADLSRANLSGANFTEADLSRANLDGANANNASFTFARAHDLVACPLGAGDCVPQPHGVLLLRATDFRGADLTGVDLSPLLMWLNGGPYLARMRSYDLVGCPPAPPAPPARTGRAGGYEDYYCLAQPATQAFAFVGPGSELWGADFEGVNLDGVHLTQLTSCPKPDSDHSCGYRGTPLGNVLLGPGVDLRGEEFIFVDLEGANLSRADLRNADFSQARLKGANLSDARLDGVTATWLRECPASLSKPWRCVRPNLKLGPNLAALLGPKARLGCATDLSFADLRGIDLSSASLGNTDFTSANMQGAILRGAVGGDANFSSANLTQVDFTDADLGPSTTDSYVNRWCHVDGGADLSEAALDDAAWHDTTCPDGSNSDTHDSTCVESP